jgi:hypothetical protein
VASILRDDIKIPRSKYKKSWTPDFSHVRSLKATQDFLQTWGETQPIFVLNATLEEA